MCVCGGGGGVLVQKNPRIKVDGSYGYSCSEYIVLRCLSIKSWIKRRGTAAFTKSVVNM